MENQAQSQPFYCPELELKCCPAVGLKTGEFSGKKLKLAYTYEGQRDPEETDHSRLEVGGYNQYGKLYTRLALGGKLCHNFQTLIHDS